MSRSEEVVVVEYKPPSVFLLLPTRIVARLDLLQFLLRVVCYFLLLLLLLVLRALSAVDLEAVHFGHVLRLWRLGHHVGIDHQQDMREGAAEVGPVDVVALLLRHVHFLAPWAEDFDAGGADFLAHADGQRVLPFAQHSGTHAECALLVLVSHDGQSLGGNYVSCVDEAVDVGGFLINGEVSACVRSYL